MSLTALQRSSLAWAARPPGPPGLWYAAGSILRSAAAALDSAGAAIMGDMSYSEGLVIPTTAVKVGGQSPAVGGASFIAPSANLVGAVKLSAGASVWYGSMVSGGVKPASIGEMSVVGDNAIVVGSVVGANAVIGAGSVVTLSTLADECSVGLGCNVGKGCTLGKGSALAAGAVLAPGTSVPAGEVWAGAPAKKVGTVSTVEAGGIVATASLTSDLGALHMEEAWKVRPLLPLPTSLSAPSQSLWRIVPTRNPPPPRFAPFSPYARSSFRVQDLSMVEQEHADYKRQAQQTPETISAMREDPGWVPLPTLGEWLAKAEVSTRTFTLK